MNQQILDLLNCRRITWVAICVRRVTNVLRFHWYKSKTIKKKDNRKLGGSTPGRTYLSIEIPFLRPYGRLLMEGKGQPPDSIKDDRSNKNWCFHHTQQIYESMCGRGHPLSYTDTLAWQKSRTSAIEPRKKKSRKSLTNFSRCCPQVGQ